MEPVFFKIIYLKYKLAVFAGLPTFLPHQAKLGLTQTQRIRAPLSETEKVMVLFFSKTQKTFKKTVGKGSGQPPLERTPPANAPGNDAGHGEQRLVAH
jgi:hypothetical protein